jgi:hypothetical protein
MKRLRMIFGIALIFFVGFACGVAVTMNPTKTTSTTAAKPAAEVPAATVAIAEAVEPAADATKAPPAAAPTETPAPATETPLPVYAIGDNVTVGEVRWIILSAVDEGQTIASDNQFVDDLTTPGKFIRLTFEIENLSKDMVTYSGIELVDNQDRTFKASTDAYSHIADEVRCVFIENLNPNIPKQCQLLFEVPANAEGLHVKVGDLQIFGFDEQVINLGL